MSSSPLASPPIAKAALYYNPRSIWSAVALFAIYEKGYGPDEIDLKVVDLNAGESYAPTYLRINPKATVPTLVVPLEKTLASGIPNKYKALTESTDVVEFLDKSRSAVSRTHTTSSAPAPALAPTTVALMNTCNAIISLIHAPEVSPIRFAVSARNIEELRQKTKSHAATIVKGRSQAAQKYLDEATSETNPKFIEAWSARTKRLSPWAKLFEDAWKEDSELTDEAKKAREAHFIAGDALWNAEAHKLFATLEREIIGPFCLGDQISLADIHLGPFVTRFVALCGGDGTKNGIDAIPTFANKTNVGVAGGHWTIGPKVRGFWEVIIQQPGWKKLYGEGVW